jgi:regulator of cell morphogenesis and NO signaling
MSGKSGKPELTVGGLLDSTPAASALLLQLGIDPQPHREKSFAELCAELDLDARAVMDVILVADVPLEEPGSAPADLDPTALGVGELLDYIVSHHHQYLRRQLPRLGLLLGKAIRDEPDECERLSVVQSLLAQMRAVYESHLVIEEQVLFPRIAELAESLEGVASYGGHLSEPMQDVACEFAELSRLFLALEQATDRYHAPLSAGAAQIAAMQELAELEAHTLTHAQIESEMLFPRALQMQRQVQTA